MGIDLVERERRKPWEHPWRFGAYPHGSPAAKWNDGDARGRNRAHKSQPLKELTAMHRDDLFPSKYLKAADVGEHTHSAVIRLVQLEELGSEREKKAVVYFRDNPKGLVLNKPILTASPISAAVTTRTIGPAARSSSAQSRWRSGDRRRLPSACAGQPLRRSSRHRPGVQRGRLRRCTACATNSMTKFRFRSEPNV